MSGSSNEEDINFSNVFIFTFRDGVNSFPYLHKEICCALVVRFCIVLLAIYESYIYIYRSLLFTFHTIKLEISFQDQGFFARLKFFHGTTLASNR